MQVLACGGEDKQDNLCCFIKLKGIYLLFLSLGDLVAKKHQPLSYPSETFVNLCVLETLWQKISTTQVPNETFVNL